MALADFTSSGFAAGTFADSSDGERASVSAGGGLSVFCAKVGCVATSRLSVRTASRQHTFIFVPRIQAAQYKGRRSRSEAFPELTWVDGPDPSSTQESEVCEPDHLSKERHGGTHSGVVRGRRRPDLCD